MLAGLLLGLCFWTGTAVAAPEPPATTSPPGSCTSGDAADQVTLPSGATAAVCDEGADAPEATTNAGTLSLTLAKTVGTDRGSCAATTEITVTSATTEAVYCYKVTNTGTATATKHGLVDDRLGTLLSNYSYNLAPGASTFATAAESLTGLGPVVINVATWTASNVDTSADATASAKVTIIDGPTAPTPVAATATEGATRLTWAVPSSNGGQVITGYQVTPFDNGTAGTAFTTNASTFAHDFPGLANGHTYKYDVQAITSKGPGAVGHSNQVAPQWWLPWTSGPKAVTEIYTWLTGKAATTAQVNAFVASANSSGKLPGDLVATLRDGTDATTNVDPVIRLYSAYFLRAPDPGGLNFWLGRRRAGWTLSKISDNFAGSSEFKNRYGSLSNQAYVELVYSNVLGRAPDAGGLSYWTGQLDAKKKSRGQVMLNFSDSNEYKNKRATYVDAVSLYLQFLAKNPTPAQLSDLEDDIEATSIAAVVRTLVHASTFPARAG